MAVKYVNEATGENFYSDEELLKHLRENLLKGTGTTDEANVGLTEAVEFLDGLETEEHDGDDEQTEEEADPDV